MKLENEEDYRLALVLLEPLLKKGFDNLTKEEETELDNLTKLIGDYEDIHYNLENL